MISLTEQASDFTALTRQLKKQVSELTDALDLDFEIVQLNVTSNAFKDGLDAGRTYIVKGGMVCMKYGNKKLYTFDEGDIILPDVGGGTDTSVHYCTDAPALLHSYETLALAQQALSSKATAGLWTRLLLTLQGIQVRIIAAKTEEEAHTTPGFAYFNEGDAIISQGDPADYVFSLFEGTADVLVDGVVVGQVSEGEVIGALAVLTHQPRSATVRASARCSVVKVPKDQFKTLIRTNPTMIHGLLTDMARHIMKLNNQVVQLSATTHRKPHI